MTGAKLYPIECGGCAPPVYVASPIGHFEDGKIVFTGVNPFKVQFWLEDRFAEADRVSKGARLEDAWNEMVGWFAEQENIRATLRMFGVDECDL